MGEIKHKWNGSVLTIISDSGASSADLKGQKGDTGPRGPQGPGGVIYNEQGELVLDLSEYYSRTEVDELLDDVVDRVDLTNYATKAFVTETIASEGFVTEQDLEEAMAEADVVSKDYVDTEIAKAQLEGAGIDTSHFITTENIEQYAPATRVDGTTIIRNEDGTISTTLGGGASFHEAYKPNITTLSYTSETIGVSITNTNIQTLLETPGSRIYVQVFSSVGILDTFSFVVALNDSGDVATTYIEANHCIDSVYGNSTFLVFTMNTVRFYEGATKENTKIYLCAEPMGNDVIGGYNTFEQINPKLIPIDGLTIIINDEGKLEAVGSSALQSSEEVEY